MINHKLINQVFHLKPAPKGLIADLVWFPDGYYTIRLYRDNFDSLPESTRVSATEWVLETLTNMNKIIPAEPEVWERPPEDK